MNLVNQSDGYMFTGTPPADTGGAVFCGCGSLFACMRADNGTNIWEAWGGREIWSSAILSGLGSDSVIYSGSEVYSMTIWNASNGAPLSWYTTGGNIPGSPAIWDGKLYFGSADNNVYCFSNTIIVDGTPPGTATPTPTATATPGTSQTPTATGTTKGTNYNLYIYAFIAVIAIVIIIVAAALLTRRKK